MELPNKYTSYVHKFHSMNQLSYIKVLRYLTLLRQPSKTYTEALSILQNLSYQHKLYLHFLFLDTNH